MTSDILYHPNLSCHARIVLIYIISRDSDWEWKTQEVVSACRISPKLAYSALKGLEANGYVHDIDGVQYFTDVALTTEDVRLMLREP